MRSSLVRRIVIALLLVSVSGCVVRTRPAHRHGHPASHRHDHCHHRGGTHNKTVCHSHPHGPGHH
jgi:hypothetical protein